MLERNGIKYISSSAISDSRIEHGFLTSVGGVSEGPYESLNFDARDTDPARNVERNRVIFSEAFGTGRLFTVNQVHGCEVFTLKGERPGATPDADAIITNEPDAAIGILTADCLPILLYDPVNGAVAAVHAGWKGTVLGIAVKTIEEMGKAFGTKPQDLKAALGPYIGPCCYEVGENVYGEFSKRHPDLGCFSRNGSSLRLDIGKANLTQLLSAGIKKERITGPGPCTSCSKGLFFSFRRDNGRTGRQLSFIMLKGQP